MLTSSTVFLAFLVVATVIFLETIVLWPMQRRGRRNTKESHPVEKWLNEQRAMVDFTFFGTPRPPLQARLALRALPNQRLVSAFGITNSLTTPSVQIHQEFMKTASQIINSGDNTRWQRLYEVAEMLLFRDAEGAQGKGLALADCAQRLCLVVVLVDNFGLDPMGIPVNSVRLVAREINSQWLLSKCNPATPKSRIINNLLGSLALKGTNGDELTAEEALGIIMPQYETLWRVVLLTFVTAYHRQYRREIIARVEGVPAYLGDVVQEVEAVKLAKEGLRLYPSNKRIYRAIAVFTDNEEKQVRNADLERCQRDERIWGADALEFQPERFDCLSALQEKAYFPYSLGLHRCPAYFGFGNRMVTMLVVAMGRILSPEKWKVRFHNDSLDEDGAEPLPTGREDMDRWTLERRMID